MEAGPALDILRRHAEAKREEKEEPPSPGERGGQTIYLPGAVDEFAHEPLDLPSFPEVSSSQVLLARYVLHLEEKRVERFRMFDDLFQRKRADLYVAGVSRLTKDFETLSREVNRAEIELRRRGLEGAADAVRSLQNAEREKLELTAATHLSYFRGEREEDEYVSGKMRKALSDIASAIEDLKAETFD